MFGTYSILDPSLGLHDNAYNKRNVPHVHMEFSLSRKVDIKHISLKWVFNPVVNKWYKGKCRVLRNCKIEEPILKMSEKSWPREI